MLLPNRGDVFSFDDARHVVLNKISAGVPFPYKKRLISIVWLLCNIFAAWKLAQLSLPAVNTTVVFSKTPSQYTGCIMPLQSSYPVWTLSVLQWRHNERDGVWDHQPHDCLLNGLFRRKSKKTSKLCVTGLCVGNSPVTGEFPAQRASIAENVSFWWRHRAGCIMPLQSPNPVWTSSVLRCVKYRVISCTAIYRVSACVCAY